MSRPSGVPARRARRARQLAHLVVILLGLMVLAYPLTVGASPQFSCRGTRMGPGDTCAKADGSAQQTYEQRLRDQRNARPVLAVGGLLIAGFGVVLLRSELRRRPA